MPRQASHLSITLPRNFAFQYSENGPHTPCESPQTTPQPPESPHPEKPFRLKRRLRPAVSSFWQKGARDATATIQQVPVPSIETPDQPCESRASQFTGRPLYQQDVSRPSSRFLTPTLPGLAVGPRTPEPEKRCSKIEDNLGESILRPLSTCSILSDSSDDSDASVSSLPAGDGSCTSPESDAADPFLLASIKRCNAKPWAHLVKTEASKSAQRWTPDMDRHLWMTYLAYLQDPTVTPFKMLPGVAPPLGVCHRVVRQARRSWRPRSSSREQRIEVKWPKSGSSTRRRLRLLCRRKPSIAPHYQRLLQSRSPSPGATGPFAPIRGRSRMSEVTTMTSPFNTRQVQISLTTSTADSMQPTGPLAQLCEDSPDWSRELPAPFASEPVPSSDLGHHDDDHRARSPDFAFPSQHSGQVTNHCPISPNSFRGNVIESSESVYRGSPARQSGQLEYPRSETTRDDLNAYTNTEFSSTAPGLAKASQSLQGPASATEDSAARALDAPFGFNTWGPSRTKGRTRARLDFQDEFTNPALQSPVRLQHHTMPAPRTHKRRALHQMEDSTDTVQALLNHSSGERHRKMRSRGFSLGDMVQTDSQQAASALPQSKTSGNLPMNAQPNPALLGIGSAIRRLDSPFQGANALPARRSPRHTATTSLGAFEDSSKFLTIDETLRMAQLDQ